MDGNRSASGLRRKNMASISIETELSMRQLQDGHGSYQ
jgi:hypothetical protein